MKMQPLKLCFPIVCFILFISSTALANNYYIDPTSNTGIENGTLDNPWTTMNFINSSIFLPGDTVFIKNGQTYPGNWYLSRSGAVGHPIVYMGYGAGSMPAIIYSIGSNIAIHIANASYVVIDGFKITDPSIASDIAHNVLSNINQGILLENSNNCTIKNCDISLVGTGIELNLGSDYTTVTNNHIYNLRMVVNTPKEINPKDDCGANGVNVQSSYNTITYNKIEDAWAVSYDYSYDGGVIEFFENTNNNTIMYNSASFCNGFLEIGSSGSATSTNNVIAYNKVTNCGNAGYFHAQGQVFGTYIYNIQYYNNVFVQTSTLGYSFDPVFFGSSGTPAAGMLIAKNNIFWSTVGTNFGDGTLNSSNFLHANNMINLRSGLPDTTLSSSDLTVIVSPWTTTSGDPSTWNYALPARSAAINFGMPVGLTTDFAGNPILGNPDAGILEYSSSADTALKATITATPISLMGAFQL